MRKSLIVLGLAALLPLLTAGTSEAQRGGGSRGGWNGGRGGVAVSTPFFSYYQGGRGGWGLSVGTGYPYGGYGYGGYRSGYGYPYGYGYGLGYGYRPFGGYYGYSPTYVYSTPLVADYYAAPAYAAVPTYNYPVAPAAYAAPQQTDNTATMQVIVPDPNAEVLVEGTPTKQRGTERTFTSPPLPPGQEFIYTITARWMQNGQPVERTQRVTVRAGGQVMVNFNALAPQGAAPAANPGTGDRVVPAVTPIPTRDNPPPAVPTDRPRPRPRHELV
jgi:uncharacterized protein (TIGR03000 family)